MTLADLTTRLRRFAGGELSLGALQASFLPVLDADPLDVEQCDSAPWDSAPEDSRLYWRLIHIFDNADDEDEPAIRRLAARLATAIAAAGSATTLELLTVLEDQERFCTIVERHLAGVISRTGFLSVIAESGYPAHVKLWLQHADAAALRRLCAALGAGAYQHAGEMMERAP